MSGVKGQKWADEKRKPQKVKITIQLNDYELSQVKKIALKKEWSISKVIYNILIGKIEHIRQQPLSRH